MRGIELTSYIVVAVIAGAGCGNSDNTGIDMEVDPIFTEAVAADITAADITHWNDAYGWGNHATAGYLTAEADPTIGARTAGKFCTTDGTTVTCQADAIGAETDPTIAAQQAGKFCTSDGVAVSCTSDVVEADPQVGSLTPSGWCAADASGTQVVCDRPTPAQGNQVCTTRVIGIAANGSLICAPDVRFLARRQTVYTWPDTGSDRIVPFDQEMYDTANAFNPATGLFAAPVAGTYSFSGTLHVQGVVSGSLVYVYLATPSGNFYGTGHNTTSTTFDQLHVTTTVRLDAGQVVSLHGYIASNPAGQLYGNAVSQYMWTYLQGTLID